MSTAIEILSKPPAGMREKRQALAEINSQIAVNRSKLGLPAAMFEFNANKAVAALLESQKQLSAKGITPAPAAVSAPVDVAPVVAAALPANVRPLADYLNRSSEDRKMFCQDGLRLTHGDFNRLNAQQKMNYIRNGGALADAPANSIAISTAARSFGNS